MKIRLLIDSRRDGKAGETVEVSPERAAFLMGIEAAEPVTEAGEQAEEPVKKLARKTTKKK